MDDEVYTKSDAIGALLEVVVLIELKEKILIRTRVGAIMEWVLQVKCLNDIYYYTLYFL